MAKIGGLPEFTWQIDANRLISWPAKHISGQAAISVFKGLKNSSGIEPKETQVFKLQFRNQKTAVRIIGKGVIVPDETRLSLPFEAVTF